MRVTDSARSLSYCPVVLDLGEVETVMESLRTARMSLERKLASGMYDDRASSLLRDKLSRVVSLLQALDAWKCEVHKS